MTIAVNKIVRINDPLPVPPLPNMLNLNLLNFFPNNRFSYNGETVDLHSLSPYVLRINDYLHENIWQGSKIYPSVDPQLEVKAKKLIWKWGAEQHVETRLNFVGSVGSTALPAYWKWRNALYTNQYPVRYPNGFHGRHDVLCSVWNMAADRDCEPNQIDQSNNMLDLPPGWVTLDYISARKLIYCRLYQRAVMITPAFQTLQRWLDAGISLQICETDVRPGIVNWDVLKQEINNPAAPFGHGYVLAACLSRCTDLFCS